MLSMSYHVSYSAIALIQSHKLLKRYIKTFFFKIIQTNMFFVFCLVVNMLSTVFVKPKKKHCFFFLNIGHL